MYLAPVTSIDLLARPAALGPLELRNRMCMPAMHLNYTRDGQVTDQLLAFYRERAAGGVAMITVGGCTVDPLGGGSTLIGLHGDRFRPGLQQLSDAIHAGGSLAIAQLYHAGRYAHSRHTGRQAVSASAVRSTLTRETPRPLSLEEIDEVQRAYAAAARRAVEAGFDGVEVLASAGYLISQFLSPLTNRREDLYGGSFDNRLRFGREVVEQVRDTVRTRKAVLVRVAGADFMPGGNSVEDSARICIAFERAGADAINVTGGWHETRVPQLTMGVPRGAFLYLARRIREAVSVPVIASNRLGDPLLAEAALQDGVADLINFGRPLMADPMLPRKVLDGELNRIVHCIACNQGCLDHVFSGKPVGCTVNPRVGQENLRKLSRSNKPRAVLVAGAGPAGMMAAITAAARGHRVTLFDRADRPGGQLRLAGATRDRREMLTLLRDLERQLRWQDVRVIYGEEVTAEVVAREQPDVVVLATGARPSFPRIEGAKLPHVVQAWDVLAGRAPVGSRVVVVGGGAVAIDTAREIALRGSLDGETLRFLLVNEAEPCETLRRRCLWGTRQVTVVEQAAKAGEGIGRSTRWTLLQQCERIGVELLTGTRVTRITRAGVELAPAEGAGPRGAAPEDEARLLEVDTVVLALGAEPRNALASRLEQSGRSVVVVGDARSPRRAYEAIHEGFLAATGI